MLKNKKGVESLIAEYIMFFIISILFFSFFLFMLNKVGRTAGIHEQMYAKKIALALDAAKPGMAIEMNVEEMFEFSEKPFVFIGRNDKGVNIVSVRLGKGAGHSYSYFSDYDVKNYILDNKDGKKLIINIEKKT